MPAKNDEKTNQRFLDRIRGCFMGVAVGDALGMPVESMTAEEILGATAGRGVRGFICPLHLKIRGTRDLPAGSTTDDTQLMLAVARSLVAFGGFDIVHQARELVAEFDRTETGWGSTTSRAARELKEWFTRRRGRSPDHPAPEQNAAGRGCGNGVAMKIAPLAVWHVIGTHMPLLPFQTDAMTLGLMTHGDPRASFAAAAVGDVIICLMHLGDERLDKEIVRLCLADLVGVIERLEARYHFFRPRRDTLSGRLRRLPNALGSAEALRKTAGTGYFALESVPFAIGVFARHPTDFRAGVLEAVNAGGDADTNAAIAGGLIGANIGLSGIPPDLVAGVRGGREVLRVADDFAAALGIR